VTKREEAVAQVGWIVCKYMYECIRLYIYVPCVYINVCACMNIFADSVYFRTIHYSIVLPVCGLVVC
jgi:hypothetical protein